MTSESLCSRLSWYYRWHGHKYGKTSPESRKNLWQGRTNHSLVCFYFSHCISIQKPLSYYLRQEGGLGKFSPVFVASNGADSNRTNYAGCTR